jgi:hypothetical protein
MKLEIVNTNGKWIVNGKTYEELNYMEKKFMDEFFREVKLKPETL